MTSAIPCMSCPPDPRPSLLPSFRCSLVVLCPFHTVVPKLHPVLELRLRRAGSPSLAWGQCWAWCTQGKLASWPLGLPGHTADSFILPSTRTHPWGCSARLSSPTLYKYPGLPHPRCRKNLALAFKLRVVVQPSGLSGSLCKASLPAQGNQQLLPV